MSTRHVRSAVAPYLSRVDPTSRSARSFRSSPVPPVRRTLRIAEAQAQLERRVANRIAIVDALTVRYDEVPDDDALILLTLHRAVAPRLVEGYFTYRDCHVHSRMICRIRILVKLIDNSLLDVSGFEKYLRV